jgi:hypothetical protein
VDGKIRARAVQMTRSKDVVLEDGCERFMVCWLGVDLLNGVDRME